MIFLINRNTMYCTFWESLIENGLLAWCARVDAEILLSLF